MPLYYLATRPETVISIVHVGRLPENLPSYIEEEEMSFFTNVTDCATTSTTNTHQTFILQLNFPSPLPTTRINIVSSSSSTGHSASLTAKQIDQSWIEKIFVFSEKGSRLLSRLFNDDCPIAIEIKPDVFPASLATQPHQTLNIHTTTFTQPRIVTKQGDILGSRMQTIINTINCVGVMGKGIALLFKERYPAMFEDYQQRCQRKEVKLGEPYLYKVNNQRWIMNFPTKGHWRAQSNINDIKQGLQFLVDHIPTWGITSLAIPPLGCGNGGLNWQEVQPLIQEYIAPLNIPIEIYAPFVGSKADQSKKAKTPPLTSIFENADKKRKHNASDSAFNNKK